MRTTHGRSRRHAATGLITGVALLFAVVMNGATATADPTAPALRNLSSGNPPGSTCAAPIEMEPQVAVNPNDPRNIVVAWDQQTAGGWEIVASTSIDTGRSWKSAVVPGLSATCDSPAGTVDPSLSFGPDGTLYLAAMRTVTGNVLATNSEAVVTSHNRGLPASWSAPVELGAGDRGVIIADPVVRNAAYVVELMTTADQAASIAVLHTSDGGGTWSAPSIAYRPSGDSAIAPDLVITGHDAAGTAQLLVLFDGGLDANVCCTFVLAVRSNDAGATWSAPTTIAETNNAFAQDPDSQSLTAHGVWDGIDNGPDAVAGNAGDVFAVWTNLNPGGQPHSGQVLISRLAPTPSGGVWSTPSVVNVATQSSSQVFLPRIAASADGTVAVTYYDDRNDIAGDAFWSADVWLATSRDHGLTWQESHVAGPFDLRPSEPAFTNYVGLSSAGTGFEAAIDLGPATKGTTGATEGTSDVFVAQLRK